MGARETARFRILLEGPICRAWYFRERFLWQTLGLPEQIVSWPPPTHTRHTERYTSEEMIDYTLGWDSEFFKDEGDYTEFIQAYLMQPLTGAHRAERERPAVPAAGVGASRAPQACERSGSRRGQEARWPELPTTMTCRGQGGEMYQIPIAPPPTDHELIGVYGSTPVCTTILCILYSYFISFDIPQNTNDFNTFVGFRRVHSPVSGANCLRDGDVAAEHRPVNHLQHPGKFL